MRKSYHYNTIAGQLGPCASVKREMRGSESLSQGLPGQKGPVPFSRGSLRDYCLVYFLSKKLHMYCKASVSNCGGLRSAATMGEQGRPADLFLVSGGGGKLERRKQAKMPYRRIRLSNSGAPHFSSYSQLTHGTL